MVDVVLPLTALLALIAAGVALVYVLATAPIFTLGDRLDPRAAPEPVPEDEMQAFIVARASALGGMTAEYYVRRRLRKVWAGLVVLAVALGVLAGALALLWG